MSIQEGGGEEDGKEPEREQGLDPGITVGGQSRAETDTLNRDICIERLSLQYHSQLLLDDTTLTLNHGNRYGLVGKNGCGKSVLLHTLANNAFKLPKGMSLYHLRKEMDPSDNSALEAVMEVDPLEKEKVEALDKFDMDESKPRAIRILTGLGFSDSMLHKKTKEYSGGWRMRIALARALFLEPDILLLDEPTNHLDMESVVWLEQYLARWDKILLLVSHSQDFMNGVCTHMIRVTDRQLVYYTGNYDQYAQTRKEADIQQQKKYEAEQKDIQQLKDFVAKFGHGTKKLAQQGKSREKILNRKLEAGLTAAVVYEHQTQFQFSDPGQQLTPMLTLEEVSFGYSPDKILYKSVDIGFDMKTRLALLGPNGAGKSTLLKLMTGELKPLAGKVGINPRLRVSKFTQHFEDVLSPLEQSALDFMAATYTQRKREDLRRFLGKFGITGEIQTAPMKLLSEGQKARIVFAKLALDTPHLLLLDEPTNALDMESIDALAKALQEFKGAVVLVSHDMRLISQVAKEILVVDNGQVKPYEGTIMDFKRALQKRLGITSREA
eukprot:jgi/Bigna1/56979/fgenesh1_pm.1_\